MAHRIAILCEGQIPDHIAMRDIRRWFDYRVLTESIGERAGVVAVKHTWLWQALLIYLWLLSTASGDYFADFVRERQP
jgi:hypothetical protein